MEELGARQGGGSSGLVTECRARFPHGGGAPLTTAALLASIVDLDLVSPIHPTGTIAVGSQIRELRRLTRAYGPGRWRKCKGLALARFEDGSICCVELHWYEAHGIGRKEIKLKWILES